MVFPTNADLAIAVKWRRMLHTMPEISGEEEQTAKIVGDMLLGAGADEIISGLGGHGIAGVFDSGRPGSTVMLRAELDGLPIKELSGVPHQSAIAGLGHLCGHDGHMATLAVVARGLSRQRPHCGRVVLLFQPAEENGAGAAAVIADPAFARLRPDFAFAYHNMPGIAVGKALLASGPVNCASSGLKLVFTGRTAHASMPESGISPMPAMAELMPALTGMGRGTIADADFSMLTITHATMGEPAFGIAPGSGEIMATLRTLTDERMEALCQAAIAMAKAVAARHGLGLAFSWHDVFRHCENAPEAVALFEKALAGEGIGHAAEGLPFRASEDFGRFGDIALSAMVFLGAGAASANLHNPEYDFNDDLIAIGSRIFMRLVRDMLG